MYLFCALLVFASLIIFIIGIVRPSSIPWCRGHRLKVVGMASVIFVGALMGMRKIDEDGDARPDASATQIATASEPASELRHADRRAADEIKFVGLIEDARSAYDAAPNYMAKGVTRLNRKAAICAAFPSTAIQGWAGTIKALPSNNEGKGGLAVEIGKDIVIATNNNASSDASYHTLVDPSSSVLASGVI